MIDKRANETLHLYVIVLYPLELSANDARLKSLKIDWITKKFNVVLRVLGINGLKEKDTFFSKTIYGQVVGHFDDEYM